LAAEIERLHGAPVQMMHLREGIFDEASVSLIATDTIREIGRLVERDLDVRRFRPNVAARLLRQIPSRRTSGWEASSCSAIRARGRA
jgi:hypothetical protein